jgi:succinoglycan biosynthesis protein ExoV
MKLLYWPGIRNFGDMLNVSIWKHFLGELLDHKEDEVFIGIGSILNTRWNFEPYRRKYVLGAGAGYGPAPKIDASWTIYCVRGPRTAQRLGVNPALGIVDPGILVRLLELEPEHGAKRKYAFMPHWSHNYDAWHCVCRDIGIDFINPQGPVDQVINDIRRTEILITEAMHGAIVADALGRAWIPVRVFERSTEHISEFKWFDWCESVKLEYRPIQLPRLFELPPDSDFFLYQHTRARRWLARRALRAVTEKGKPVLSSRILLQERQDALLQRIEGFRQDMSERGIQLTAG